MIHFDISADSPEELRTTIVSLAAMFGATPAVAAVAVTEPAGETKPARRSRKAAEQDTSAPDVQNIQHTETSTEQAEAKADEPAVQQSEPEKPSQPAEPEFKDVDTLRQFIVGEYLNVAFSDPNKRAEKFRAILSNFNLTKLGDAPVASFDEIAAYVRGKLAEAVKS